MEHLFKRRVSSANRSIGRSMVRLHLIAAVAPFSDFRFSHFALGTLQQMGNLEVEVSCLLNFHGRPSEGPPQQRI